MIDITKAKADAEEGLRIAADATEGPWELWDGNFSVHAGPSTENNPGCIAGCRAEICEADPFQLECESTAEDCDDGEDIGDHAEAVTGANLAFIADSRTRAPEAYRNVIALVDENARLRATREEARLELAEFGRDVERLTKERDEAIADYNRSIANREQDLAEFRALSVRVTAAEAAEEKMTRKAEEHYDRAAKMEAQRATLLDALLSVRDAAASDRGYALIDRIYAIANKVLK